MTRPDPTPFDDRIGDGLDRLAGAIDKARARAELLSDSEIRFVDGLLLRVDRYGSGTFVSDRQRRWLKDIEARVDAAEEDPGGA
ncbi:MAG: hypothetical protein OXC28_07290 [Defluviicoccus sp.]|nr:hypothetical protein [Defluviicoccus sp.]